MPFSISEWRGWELGRRTVSTYCTTHEATFGYCIIPHPNRIIRLRLVPTYPSFHFCEYSTSRRGASKESFQVTRAPTRLSTIISSSQTIRDYGGHGRLAFRGILLGLIQTGVASGTPGLLQTHGRENGEILDRALDYRIPLAYGLAYGA